MLFSLSFISIHSSTYSSWIFLILFLLHMYILLLVLPASSYYFFSPSFIFQLFLPSSTYSFLSFLHLFILLLYFFFNLSVSSYSFLSPSFICSFFYFFLLHFLLPFFSFLHLFILILIPPVSSYSFFSLSSSPCPLFIFAPPSCCSYIQQRMFMLY